MFMDLILDNHIQTQRLDTLEEVSEPASSEYWQLDSIGSKDSATNVTTIATAGKYRRNGTLLLRGVRYCTGGYFYFMKSYYRKNFFVWSKFPRANVQYF